MTQEQKDAAKKEAEVKKMDDLLRLVRQVESKADAKA